jgi:hypothetical protein
MERTAVQMRNTKRQLLTNLNSQRGVTTIDFLFSIVIAIGIGGVLFALSFTLSVVEITQYIAYASARSQVGAQLTPELQMDAARRKYRELTTTGTFSSLFRGGWFEISRPDQLEVKSGFQGDSFNDEYNASFGGFTNEDDLIPFVGVRTKLTAKMLAFNVPFIGRTGNDPEGFGTRITGFLIREPSSQECMDFMAQRHSAIRALDPRFTNLNLVDADYIPMEDNGC